MDEPRSDRTAPRPPVTDTAKERPAVVVLHGLWMPGTETVLIRRRLAQAGFTPYLFRYHSVDLSLRENAERLSAFVARLPHEVVHLVGHSLGGVVALAMLAAHEPARRGRVVCIGSPLRGTGVGARLARFALGRRVLGRCICDLLAQGGLQPWRGTREVGILAGSGALGLGRFLGGLEGEHDGMVAVAETALPGAADHVVLRVSHTQFLWSQEALEQIVTFLRTGHFGHPAAAAPPSLNA